MVDYLRIILSARKAKLDERGASAVEYGLLIAGIAALVVAVVFLFGGAIEGIFNDTCATVQADNGVAADNAQCVDENAPAPAAG